MVDTYSPVPELNLLKEFDDRFDTYYSQSFELTDYGADSGIDTWSSDPEFLDGFRSFAQANGSGSIYAIWRLDDREDLATLPIVAFGDEGGIHLVARDLRELYRLLGCDRHVYVLPEGVNFSDAHDTDTPDVTATDADTDAATDAFGPSDSHEQYVAWLKRHFDLAPAKDPDAVVAAATEEFAPRLVSWVDRYVEGFREEYEKTAER